MKTCVVMGRFETLGKLGFLRDVVFSRDKKLAAILAGGNVIVYDLGTGAESKRIAIPPLGEEKGDIERLAVSASGDSFVVAGRRAIVKLDGSGAKTWQVEYQSERGDPIGSLGYGAEAGIVLAGISPSTLVVLDASNGRELKKIEGQGSHGVRLSADGRLFGGRSERGIRVSDPNFGEALLTVQGEAVDFDVAGGLLVRGLMRASLYPPRGATPLREIPPVSPAIARVAVSDDGTLIATRAREGMVRVWNASDGRLVRTLKVPGEMVQNYGFGLIAWKPGSHILALADEKLLLWNTDDTSPPRELAWRGGTDSLAYTRDGTGLVALRGCRGYAYDAETGEAVREIGREYDNCDTPSLSPDGATIAASYGRRAFSENVARSIAIYRPMGGEPVHTIVPNRPNIASVAHSPDGSTLAAAGKNGVTLFDARTGAMVREIDSEELGDFAGVVWSRDGSRLAALTKERLACVWDAKTGKMLEKHPFAGEQVTFAGKSLVTTGSGLTIWTEPPTRIGFDSSGNWASVHDGKMLRHDTGTLLLKSSGKPGAFETLAPPKHGAGPLLTARAVSGPKLEEERGMMSKLELDVKNEGTGRAYWVGVTGTSVPPGAFVESNRVQRLEPGATARLAVRLFPPFDKADQATAVTLKVVHAHGEGPTVSSRLEAIPMGWVTFKDAKLVKRDAGFAVEVQFENSGTGPIDPLVVTAKLTRGGRVVERTVEKAVFAVKATRVLAVPVPKLFQDDHEPFILELFANPGLWPNRAFTKAYELRVPSKWAKFVWPGVAGAVLLLLGVAFWRRRRAPG